MLETGVKKSVESLIVIERRALSRDTENGCHHTASNTTIVVGLTLIS